MTLYQLFEMEGEFLDIFYHIDVQDHIQKEVHLQELNQTVLEF